MAKGHLAFHASTECVVWNVEKAGDGSWFSFFSDVCVICDGSLGSCPNTFFHACAGGIKIVLQAEEEVVSRQRWRRRSILAASASQEVEAEEVKTRCQYHASLTATWLRSWSLPASVGRLAIQLCGCFLWETKLDERTEPSCSSCCSVEEIDPWDWIAWEQVATDLWFLWKVGDHFSGYF